MHGLQGCCEDICESHTVGYSINGNNGLLPFVGPSKLRHINPPSSGKTLGKG